MSHSHHEIQEEVYDKTVFGFWVFLMSDCLLFGPLFASYAVLQNNTYGGPPARELFDLPFVLVQSLLFLLCSFAAGPALLAAYRQKKNQALSWLLGVFFLAVVFLAMEGVDCARLIESGNSWQRSAFLSSYFTLIGTHGLHILAGLIWMGAILVQLMSRGLTAEVLRRLTCLRLYWHFLAVVWGFIFTFVYLIGALG